MFYSGWSADLDFVLDYETDTVIQSSLRKELDKDVTLLTVAHRLQTIMDADKIVSSSPIPMSPSSDTDALYRWCSTQVKL